MVNVVSVNSLSTCEMITTLVNIARNNPVGANTIHWQRCEHDLQSRRLAQAPVLAARYRRNRLELAGWYAHSTEVDRKQVLFTVESKFCPADPDGHACMWRHSEQWYNQQMFTHRTK